MLASIGYIFLAIIGLGVLVFIHELGHYWVARRRGMRVEAFAIGFGRPLFKWQRDGVQWQIGILPFGGYVKIAGMQKEEGREPSEIPDGFYGKTPWDRIQVALAGPLVNIGFALLVFTCLWLTGGREKPFAEFTHRIGWVDPKSALYEKGVRPGDLIQKYDGRPFTGFKDLLLASIKKGETTQIEGKKVDYTTGEEKPFNYTLKTYVSPDHIGREKLNTIGVLSPARYLIYAGDLPAASPMAASGIKPQDRILWVDGEVVFSHQQLAALVNESAAFLTVQRGETSFQTKVPRVPLADLKLTAPERGEIDDWQHEAKLGKRFSDLYFIPYNLSPSAQVEGQLPFIDEKDQAKAFQLCQRCAHFQPLHEGDQIIAVDGIAIQTPYQLLSELQQRHVLMIVERNPALSQKTLWTTADVQYDQFSTQHLQAIVSSIGTSHPVAEAGDLYLLNPVTPKALKEVSEADLIKARKAAEKIPDSQKRTEALHALDQTEQKLVLGLPLMDREVQYNPTPGQQFIEVFKDTYRTLASLITGSVAPKYIAGPVGIVQIVHQSWMIGAKEALFWMALISLNLGIINLLPLPVLDGGHIAFALVEMITRRPIKAKTMERMVIPFVVLLIGFFVFVTYNDLARLFSKLLW